METVVQNKTASEILNEAADFLELGNRYMKGAAFTPNTNVPEQGCWMSAHGAILYVASSDIRDLVDKNNIPKDMCAFVCGGTDVMFYQLWADKVSIDLEQYLLENHGVGFVACSRAVQVGLNYIYQNDASTTMQDVINKLREAAKL